MQRILYILPSILVLFIALPIIAQKKISRAREKGDIIHASSVRMQDHKGEYLVPIFEGKGDVVDNVQLNIEEPDHKHHLYNLGVSFEKGHANKKLQSFFDFYEQTLLRKVRRIWIKKAAYGITEIEFEYQGRIGCLGLQTMGIEVYPRQQMKSYREIRLYEKKIVIADRLVDQFLYDIYMDTECRKD